ncbi:hypothetical protein M885DRAFT_521584 [Pelagophyceae sp. CCMP2097]|nr:hypothetical protein M885DRAFT_521584 [Pelagophyceae sp. CCMP2097]
MSTPLRRSVPGGAPGNLHDTPSYTNASAHRYYTAIVVSPGFYEFLGKASEQRSVDDVFADVRRLFVHGPFAPRLAPELIYRTPPLPDSPETARVKELNARVRGLFRAHGVPFLDHDMIVRPRSLGAGRDAPDHLSKVHLGPMARSVLASSFLNAFKDLRARRRRYNASLP